MEDEMTKDELLAAIAAQPKLPYATVSAYPHKHKRGQGKRSGGMVKGAMSYGGSSATSDLFGLLVKEMSREDVIDLRSLVGRQIIDYSQARAYGLNHENALLYAKNGIDALYIVLHEAAE
jgi:hypothetical protein